MKYIVDRIEQDKVICENQENGEIEQFLKKQFPETIKDGDCVVFKDGKFEIDIKETESKKESIDELMKKLMKG